MIPEAAVRSLVSALHARDASRAMALVLGLADQGAPLPELLVDVIGAAQVEVGQQWLLDAFSVADEHAATAISDAAVSVLTAGTDPPRHDGPRVAVVCAEGEWHLLAARILAEVLRAEGFPVTFLGASLPPSHLARFLADEPPDVLAISCTTALALGGVMMCTQVAHHAGVPVLVGGAALGGDDRRARALGADLWAPDAAGAIALLRRPLPTELSVASADVRSASDVAHHRDAIVERTLAAMEDRLTAYTTYSEPQRQRTREDLGYIVDFAHAAVLTGDPRLLVDALSWLEILLSARGVGPDVLKPSLGLLMEASDVPALTEVLRVSVDASGLRS